MILYTVIPCYNEEKVLSETIKVMEEKYSSLMKKELISKESRVLFVDDGSRDDTWEMMSVSREPLSDLMRYFKDFDELDRNELHLRRFLSEKEYAEEGSEYYKEYRKAVSNHERMQRAWYF